MIDIHTHVLPYIDDGARDQKEALYMLKVLKRQGTETIVCTPHFDPGKIALKDFTIGRNKALLALEGSGIQLIPASETRYHDLLFYISDIDKLCINNTSYLLLELPYTEKRSGLETEGIRKLMKLYQITPILAHIERYKALWKNRKNIRHMISLGCVIQINADTVIDKSSRRTALNYIKGGLIDVVGSDCHSMLKRPPNLKDALDIIEKELGSYYSDLLCRNTELIIKGKMLREDIKRLMLRGSEL